MKEVAGLAALIESIYLDQCEQIARSVEVKGLSRMEALRQLIEDNELLPSPENLPSAIEESGLGKTQAEYERS